MGFLSSKTLIKGHALFVFTLAVYLTKSPEVVTESDVVFMLGELLRLDSSTTPSFSRPQSPFAMCGILLAAEALIDLILITKIPHLNEILTMAEAARREAPGAVNGLERMRTNPFIARLTTLYSEIWTLLSLARFCLFFAVSFFIYQSKPDSWKAAADRVVRGSASVSAEPSGLDQLKNRVVFTYGFMEMMFWFWIYITLREERQEVSQQFAERERDQ